VFVLGSASVAFAAAPTAATSAATGITSTSAVLNGSGNPNGQDTSGWFRYDTTSPGTCNDNFGTRVPATSGTGLGTGTTSVIYSITASGLSPGVTYFFCAITSNGAGTGFGGILSFTTPAPPSVSTTGASSVTSNSAVLNGSVNPTAAATTGWFRFSLTNPGTCDDVFGTRIPTTAGTGTSLGSGIVPVAYGINTNLYTTLTPGTTYYYCAIASNSQGTSFGAVSSFTTNPIAPGVSTLAASNLTATGATLNANVNPGGGDTTGWFRYSPTNPGSCSDTFGTRVPTGTGGTDLGATNTTVPFAQAITGLTMGTTYFYCAIANNGAGTTFGGIVSFTTPTAPTVTTNAATNILDTSVTLNATVNPDGAATTAWFRYGTTSPGTCNDTFGTRVPATGAQDMGSGSSPVSLILSPTGLAPTTTYFFCAIANNGLGTVMGAVLSFTTHDKPTVTTAAVTLLTSNSAQLNGSSNPNGASATGWFRFATTDPGSCSDSFGTRVPTSGGTALGTGTTAVNYGVNTNTVTSLSPGTLYYYCAISSNTFGPNFGPVQTFTTLAALPSVSTGAVSALTATTATLNGSANPGGGSTLGWFRYSTTSPGTCNDTFGTRVPAAPNGSDLGSGNGTSVPFNQPITGLTKGTTYFYCAIANNSAGTGFGGLGSFTTPTQPTVTTTAATGISNVQATLNGTANPNGDTALGWFRLATTNPGTCDDMFGTRVPTVGNVTLGNGTGVVGYNQPASGLLPNTTYFYCALASNSLGTSFGTVMSFTTFDQPAVTTSAATAITSGSAQLNGSANPNGATAIGWFRFSTTDPGTCNDNFGTRVPVTVGTGANLSSGRAAVPYAFNTNNALTLSPGTTYYFCAIASNTYGTAFGTRMSFTTPAVAPQVSTGAATSVTDSTATLNATAVAGGAATTGWFRYSPTNPGSCSDTFGTRVPTGTGGSDLGSGNTTIPFTQALTGLSQGTTYFYCALASNGQGTVFGFLGSFTTQSAPTVTTAAATGVGDTVATLNGTANPNGNDAMGWFRYDTTNPGTCTDMFGTRVPTSGATDLGAGSSAVAFSQALTGLAPSTTYYYCALASNSLGPGVGTVQSFVTKAKAAVTTLAASALTTISAQLNGSANPNGASTIGWFRFSATAPAACDDTFGTRVPITAGTGSNLGTGTAAVTFAFNTNTVISLTPGTTYYYCAIAQNSFGTSFGSVVPFTASVALPTVSTLGATPVTATTATLNASATPGGGSTTGWFRYSATNPGTCSDTFGTRVPATGGTDLGAGNASVAFSQAITGLTQGTTYFYCALASNSAGPAFGGVTSFVTPTAPAVTTSAATAILDVSATLNGSANPNRDPATGWFRYSTTNPVTCDDMFGTRVPAASGTALGNGTGAVAFAQSVTGLTPNTVYYVCALASNSLGTAVGTVVTFTTHAIPAVTTNAATVLTSLSAQLNGAGNPNGATATAWFRYATTNPNTCTDTFGTRLPSTVGTGTNLGAGTAAVSYSINTNTLANLTPGTTYYYCAIVQNQFGTGFGQIQTFITPPALPVVSTSAATPITSTGATLNASVNPGGGDTTGWFRYSATFPGTCNDTFGTRVPTGSGGTDLGTGNASVALSQAITGLAQGTTYYFCAIAQNSAGPAFGSVLSFVTLTSPTVTTNAASGVSNVLATLNGSANPNGDPATGWFRFGTTNPVTCDDSFGTRVPTIGNVTLGGGTSAVPFSQPASGLAGNTTYWVCAIAQNSLGTSFGQPVSFTTFDKPAMTTSPATGVTSSSAQLNGAGNPNGATTTAWFRFSTTAPAACDDVFGTRVPTTVGTGTNLNAGRTAVSYGINTNTVVGLLPGTTYYFCAIGNNAYGTSFGQPQSFTTPPVLPQVTTNSATGLTSTGATLNGAAVPGGASTTGWFRYSATYPGLCSDTFGTRVPATGGTDLGSGTASVPFTQTLTTLSPNVTYYFCAIASNSVGIAYGALGQFTAPATPTVSTLAATPVTSMTATLNGAANPNGNATTGWFRYATAAPSACNDSFGIRVPATSGTSLGSSTTVASYSQQITSLTPGTTYYFCAVANNSQGTAFGTVLSFTTPVSDQAPGVTTVAATAVSGTGATLNGTANPNGSPTTGWFRYATTSPGSCTDTFGTRVPAGTGGTSLGSTNSPMPYSQALTGLTAGTTYFYCALAQNGAGTSVGSVLSFTTAVPPTVSTDAASAIGPTTATLNGSANPRGAATTAWFRYDTTNPSSCDDTFGTRTPASADAALGAGTTAVTFSQALSGLASNTTYYYCAIAQNGAGTAFGTVQSFVTPLAPTVLTLAASSVASTSATINGSADPNGGATTGWFRVSSTNPGACDDSFGTRAPASGGSDLGSGSSAVAYAQALTGLAPSSTYYYCAIAANGVGTAFGDVLSFTTPAAPTVTTAAATAITGTGAALNGSANPNMADATGYFRYDTSNPGSCNDTFGTRVPASAPTGTDLGVGVAAVAFSQTLIGLTRGATYYFCAIAINSEGTGTGAVLSFTTLAAPTVVTAPATGVASTTATLNGSANPGGDTTVGYFRYGTTNPGTCTDTFGTRAPASGGSSLGSGTSSAAFADTETTLLPGTTYYFCAVAQNSVGTAFGSVQSFVTLAQPSVTTLAASGVSSTAATLNGTATPNGSPTTGWFRYGTTDPGTCSDLYGTRIPDTGGASLGAGSTAAPFSQPLTGLTPGTTYYFCAIAENAVGASAGTALTFTTSAIAPTVTTSSVSGVTANSANMNGSANPNGADATGWFRFGTTNPGTCNDSFGTRVPAGSGGTALGAGTAAVAFTQTATGVAAGVTYYFCAIASNSVGTSFGAVISFRIDAPPPTVSTEAATAVAATGATLNGSANPNGTSATGWFRYDTTMPAACNDSFGTRAPASGGTDLGSGTAAMDYAAPLTGLEPNLTYYYCAIASNAGGAAFGNVMSFTTLTAAPTVRTLAAATTSDGHKTLGGAANPHGLTGAGWFLYGTTDPGTCADGFGTRVPATDIALGSVHNDVMLTTTLGDLAPGAYYYCAAASNSVGTTYGAVVRFDVAQTGGTDGGTTDGGGTDGGVGGTDGGTSGTGGAGGVGATDGGTGGTTGSAGAGGAAGTGGAAGRGGAGGATGTAGAGGRGGAGGNADAGAGTAGTTGSGGTTADAGTDASAPPPGGSSGCHCGVTSTSPRTSAAMALLLALALATRRRRRR
jgi:MYXO-CTERM domain-containing protein